MFVGGVLALDYAAPAKLLPSVFHEHWQLRLRGASVAGRAFNGTGPSKTAKKDACFEGFTGVIGRYPVAYTDIETTGI